MRKTIAIAAGALAAAVLSMASTPASAGVSLSIGVNLPLAPGVRIGGVITNRPFRPAPRVVLAPRVVAYPAPVIYAPPVVYGPPVVYAPRRVVYAPPIRRHAIAAPAPRWHGPSPRPVAYMAPGDRRHR